MKLKKPLESVGWLSGAGYQTIVDEEAKKVATSTRQAKETLCGSDEAGKGTALAAKANG